MNIDRKQKNDESSETVGAVGIYLGVMLLLLLILLSSYNRQMEVFKEDIFQQEQHVVELIEKAILNHLTNAILDTQFQANQQNLFDLDKNNQQDFQEISQNFKTLQRIKNYYHQIRFINNQGKEVVRIDNHKGRPQVVPPDQLQDKSQRYYFKQGIVLRAGQTYLSPLDLNVEHGILEVPYRPMIRLAAPVINPGSQKTLGVVVLNMNAALLLAEFKQYTGQMAGELMLLNGEGYWLFGGEQKLNWAFMFPDKTGLRADLLLPELWQQISRNNSGQTNIDEAIYVYKTFQAGVNLPVSRHNNQLVNWPEWKILSRIPPNYISTQLEDDRYFLTMLYILLGALFAALMVLILRARQKMLLAEQEVNRMAMYDNLTGIANRRMFSEVMEEEMARAQRYHSNLTIMYMDLDNFKLINDQLGHQAGDRALQITTKRVKACLRKTDTLARLGGDEFAVILPHSGSEVELSKLAERLIENVSKPMDLQGEQRQLGMTIGICIVTDINESIESIIHKADTALYDGKKAGRNCYRFA